MNLLTCDEMKKGFRVAYDFMNDHISALETPEDYLKLADDMRNAIADNMDHPLTCRLLSGVCDFICAESKRLTNDT